MKTTRVKMEVHVLTFLQKTAKVISANVKNHFTERTVNKCSKVSLQCSYTITAKTVYVLDNL